MSNKNKLYEYLDYGHNQMVMEEVSNGSGKDVYMKGIFIQGDVRNHNQRVYPVREIAKAVSEMNKRIQATNGVPGELDHPTELTINADRISHIITEMEMDKNCGIGKLKILPTPMGNIVRTLLQSGLKLGVSSRGSGEVDDNGVVSDFEISTIDVVVQPSAPDAYPRTIYESLYNMKGGAVMFETARYSHIDDSARRQTVKDSLRFIEELKIRK